MSSAEGKKLILSVSRGGDEAEGNIEIRRKKNFKWFDFFNWFVIKLDIH